MTSLRYLGPTSQESMATRSHLDGLDLKTYSQSEIDDLVYQTLGDKANTAYIDSAKASLTSSSLSSVGTGKIAKTLVNTSNGPASLTSGKIDRSTVPSGISGARIQVFKYNSMSIGVVTATRTSPVNVATLTLPDLGYYYYPVLQGYVVVDGPNGMELQVKYGSRTGSVFGRAVSGNSPSSQAISFYPVEGLSRVLSGELYITAGTKFANQSSKIVKHDYSVLCIPA